jgi:hypothetical protein
MERRSVTFKEADQVANKLDRKLGSPPWLRGIGVEPDAAEGFAVTVRIASDAPTPALPERMQGVAVHVTRRDRARPRVA